MSSVYSDHPETLEPIMTSCLSFRPLLQQFARGKHPALIYAYVYLPLFKSHNLVSNLTYHSNFTSGPSPQKRLLVNRTQFLREAETELAYQNINQTRATLSELLAVKILPLFAERGPMELVQVLTATFNPFGGAKVDMFEFGRSFGGGGGGGDGRVGSGEGRGRDDGEEGEDDWGEDDVDERGVEDLKDWGRREGGNALEVCFRGNALPTATHAYHQPDCYYTSRTRDRWPSSREPKSSSGLPFVSGSSTISIPAE